MPQHITAGYIQPNDQLIDMYLTVFIAFVLRNCYDKIVCLQTMGIHSKLVYMIYVSAEIIMGVFAVALHRKLTRTVIHPVNTIGVHICNFVICTVDQHH